MQHLMRGEIDLFLTFNDETEVENASEKETKDQIFPKTACKWIIFLFVVWLLKRSWSDFSDLTAAPHPSAPHVS